MRQVFIQTNDDIITENPESNCPVKLGSIEETPVLGL